MPSPVGMAVMTAGMYSMSRYATDIGVRTDVIKVAVEDLPLNLESFSSEEDEDDDEAEEEEEAPTTKKNEDSKMLVAMWFQLHFLVDGAAS